jgi:SAM-dependent methyltransferase
MAAGYVFGDTEHQGELERLRALERAFDPETQRWLLACGVQEGWRCVEVGAGAGTIARWLAGVVGREGHVAAVDLDGRFLADAAPAGVEVVTGDVREARLAAGAADLVHARFVLIHQTDPRGVLQAMLRALRPGGRLVLEEPDFTMARALAGSPRRRAAFARVNRAIENMFERRGMDPGFGARLPELLHELGLESLVADGAAPIDRGGGPVAAMMAMSTGALRERYLETGLANADDLDGYLAVAADPACWATYHGVVRASARTPA